LVATTLDALRRSPRAVRIGVLAGAVVLVLGLGFGGVVALTGGKGATAQTPPSPSAVVPPFATKEYLDTARNFAVNVPESWTKSNTTSYVEFVDPNNAGRKLRVNVGKSDVSARALLVSAENRLKDPKNCPEPYQRVGDLRDTQLAGQPATELEYTCGQGEPMRHGIWRAIVVSGKTYNFYVTVPDSRFNDDKVIFEEMVRSFRLLA
jgi:hypothetical protein